jgi:hypothetical protein
MFPARRSSADEKAELFVGCIGVLVVLGLLIAAIAQAMSGNWPAAIFLAILWNGLKTTRIRTD